MSAIISPCGKYRYRLDREVQMDGKVFAYFGINPSTADATENDATIRKLIGFIVSNPFAFRSKNVRDLAIVDDPIGPKNWACLRVIIGEADILVPCWGSRTKAPKELRHYLDTLMECLHASGKPVLHFGLTASGDPMHPQMLAYKTPLLPLQRGEQLPQGGE